MFQPQLPRVFRYTFIHAFSKLPFPRHSIEAGQIFIELHAMHDARSGLGGLVGGRRRSAIFTGQKLILLKKLLFDLTASCRKFLVAKRSLLRTAHARNGQRWPRHFRRDSPTWGK